METWCYCLQILQLHDTPFNSLIKVLKAVRFSFILILKSRVFQILGPEDLRPLVPNVGSFVLGRFKFYWYLCQTTCVFLFTSIFFVGKSVFILLIAFYISTHMNLILRKFLSGFLDFCSSGLYVRVVIIIQEKSYVNFEFHFVIFYVKSSTQGGSS